jgi:hypothetical protein
MSGPNPSRLYKKQFEAAGKLFDDGDIANCIAAAKKILLYVPRASYRNMCDSCIASNRTKGTLRPPLLHNQDLRSSCLRSGRLEHLLSAEEMYETHFEIATQQRDTNALEVLTVLREELSELWDFGIEDSRC